MQVDFAENFLIKQQDEIMSAHWITEGVTLYTAVLHSKKTTTSFVVGSEDLHHDKSTVFSYNKEILKAHIDFNNTPISKLHIFSDGASGQFKNRFTLTQF